MSSAQSPLRIVAHQGNSFFFLVTLKNYGSRAPKNVSTASSISLEWENAARVHQPPVICLSNSPGADWANGIVALPVGPPITDALGAATFSLTVVLGGQTTTYATGAIEVRERPGYPTP